MNPILFPENTSSWDFGQANTPFPTNGLGRMSDAISCKVTEERNGEYELVMVYPVDGIHFTDLAKRMILYAIHDDTKDKQPFRIYEITKPMNGLVTIRARHVSYDLNKIVVSPFTASTCAAAIVGLESHSATANPFRFSTDKQVEADFKLEIPSACRSVLGGSEGSILDTFGTGEYEWDHWQVNLHLHRGRDTDVEIRYGKNMTELEETSNVSNTFNAVYPYWKGEEENGNGEYVSRIVYISDDPQQRVVYAGLTDEHDIIEVVPLDLSDQWDKPPTALQLRSKAESYLSVNNPWEENHNISVSFVALWQTEEYKNIAALERLNLCDTVTVIHKKLGVKVTKKIIKVEYDVLAERYISMELGSASKSFTSALKSEVSSGLNKVRSDISLVKTLITPKSAIDAAVDHATEMIRGGLGGYVVINPDETTGYPKEILIMDEPDMNTAENVWRFNSGGLAFSSHGYDGPYDKVALTADGQIMANAITAGILNANIIKAGILSDPNNKFSLDMLSGTINMKDAHLVNADATGSFSAYRKMYFGSSEDGPTILSTELSSGYVTFSKNSIPFGTVTVEGRVWISRFYGDQPYDSWNFNVGEGAKSMAFLRPATPDEQQYHGMPYTWVFLVNNGINPDGYTEDVYIPSLLTDYIRFDSRSYGLDASVPSPYVSVGTDGSLVIGLPEPEIEMCGVGVYGRKNRIVKTDNYGWVLMDATESCVPLFTDIGSGIIGDDNTCLVFFDPKFMETVDLSHAYQVFLSHAGDSIDQDNVSLRAEKHENYFKVVGPSGTQFDWIVYARQRGYVYARMDNMEQSDEKYERPLSELEQLADQYIKNYEREVYDL